MNEDFYVLGRTGDEFEIEKSLWDTVPRSIFTVNTPLDSTLHFRGDSVYVQVYIDQSPIGQEADSTHLRLTMTTEQVLLTVSYIYNIGLLNLLSWSRSFLVGAVVNDKVVGDTTWINNVIHTEVEGEPLLFPDAIDLIAYPNPFREQTQIVLQAGWAGEYEVAIHDILGREVYRARRWLFSGERWERTWPDRSVQLPSGIYFIRATSDQKRSDVIAVTSVN